MSDCAIEPNAVGRITVCASMQSNSGLASLLSYICAPLCALPPSPHFPTLPRSPGSTVLHTFIHPQVISTITQGRRLIQCSVREVVISPSIYNGSQDGKEQGKTQRKG